MPHRTPADAPSVAGSDLTDTELELVLGTPGGSAQREFERRRDAHEERVRGRFGALGVALARLGARPDDDKAWQKGAAGERQVAARLAKHLGESGVRLLHDRHIPGSLANIDHLAVGPGGVTVIDAKNLSGKVRVERRGGLFSKRREYLRVDGRDRTKLVEGLQRQVDVVRRALDDAGLSGIRVEGALCMARSEGLPAFGDLKIGDCVVTSPRRVARLARRPGLLSPGEIDWVMRRLAQALPAA